MCTRMENLAPLTEWAQDDQSLVGMIPPDPRHAAGGGGHAVAAPAPDRSDHYDRPSLPVAASVSVHR